LARRVGIVDLLDIVQIKAEWKKHKVPSVPTATEFEELQTQLQQIRENPKRESLFSFLIGPIFEFMEDEIHYRPLEIFHANTKSAVVKACKPENKTLVACKLSRREDDESEILQKLNGKHHTIQLLDLFDVKISSYYQVMVFPYYNRTLDSKYHKKFAPQLMKQLFEAIAFCHAQGIIHRDIKPSNILVSDNNELVLADFGLACQSKGTKQTEFCGTLEYMAPEIIQHEPYTYSVDIWSAGMTFYELLTGSHPFTSFTERKLRLLFKNWRKQKKITLELKNLSTLERKLIRLMLRRIPSNRPTASNFMPSLAQNSWPKICTL